MSNLLAIVFRALFGIYAWLTFAILGLITLICLLITPALHLRRSLARHAARFMLRIIGIRCTLHNAELLPQTPCVVVANHSSYVDGLVLKAALPAHFSFVIKKEMVQVPLAGLLLQRIGSFFVDRANRHAGAMDARRIMREATEGKSLVFFPEGTFTPRIGLERFHLGAFVTALHATLPVVPVAIHGARRVLRPGNPWPRPGEISVDILGVIDGIAQTSGRSAAEALRDQARARILLALGEPDLQNEPAVAPPDDGVTP
ncbi:MAG TPA: lysophospholipid acyltransferase family protein [Steroidobacteraceae bacterium]|nr:lysophospholipid acyltransferase family protein [Steroidobacteraceae bacterium]